MLNNILILRYIYANIKIIRIISSGLPVVFADVRLYVPKKDLWIFANSDNHASYYALLSLDPRENLKKVTLWLAIRNILPNRLGFSRIRYKLQEK